MVKDWLMNIGILVLVLTIAWLLLKPRDPKWLREVKQREHTNSEVIPALLTDPTVKVLATVTHAQLIESGYAEVDEFVRKGVDGSLMTVTIYGPESMSPSFIASVTRRVDERARTAGAVVKQTVLRRHPSGSLLEVRLSRP